MDAYVDVLIPRGGARLHRLCKDESSIPVITGGIGICHAYVDRTCDVDAALDIIENAKPHRPSVCNALDTVLIHEDIATSFLPKLVERMASCGVAMKGTQAVRKALEVSSGQAHGVTEAGPDDFDTEWMALVLGSKIVATMDEAIDHIHAHSMDHSDAILTTDLERAERFVAGVQSSAVFVNASTRFNDGGQFGLGAEVAVSTQKLHARGPMGLTCPQYDSGCGWTSGSIK